jgi:hypothetical protein
VPEPVPAHIAWDILRLPKVLALPNYFGLRPTQINRPYRLDLALGQNLSVPLIEIIEIKKRTLNQGFHLIHSCGDRTNMQTDK